MNPTPMLRRARRALSVAALLAAGLPLAAQAWWNEDYAERTLVTLDTTAQGVAVKEAVTGLPLAIRLHSGNFDFLAARPDGSDLRVLAADDKTVLPHRIERFDATNELAVLWVQLPTVAPGSDQNRVHVYAGNEKATAEAAAPGTLGDTALRFIVHFDDADRTGTDAAAGLKTVGTLTPEANAVLAGGARLAGTPLVWPAAPGLQIAAGGPATLALWWRADALAAGTVATLGPLSLVQAADGRLGARVGGTALDGGQLAAGAWTHLALVLEGAQARLYVNGAEVAQAAVATPAVQAELRVGEGLSGAVDEISLAASARPAAWLQLVAAAQGPDGKLLRSQRESAGQAEDGEEHGYMGILVKNLTVDAWVVIIILGVMFVLAAVVMVSKLRYIGRADADNRRFLARFREAGDDLLQLDQGAQHPHASLYRLYLAGQRELAKRQAGVAGAPALSGASLDAVKASVDADLVRESHRLNAHMVWLTIAISGGPFLGLLGTVVGVMITFAAIAAAGDVNVNAIAPGIAAALLATVAGLGVAIPALFGYNYLASRIKNLSADMQIFVDEFITRVAEAYGAR
jgi:biopolymer transport protein ExbB